jgi:hypothetical protein
MATVRVTPLESSDPHRAAASVLLPDGTQAEVHLEATVPLVAGATRWVPALVPVAMGTGSDLAVDGPVDPAAVEGARAAQQVLHGWYPHLRVAAIDAPAGTDLPAPVAGVGCFFSGGVDSFYSVLQHRDEITHLVFVHGFDIPIADEDLGDRARAAVRAAAASLGLTLLEVRTDLRRVSDGRADWQTLYHGAAMAAVAHALSDHVGRIIVPGSYNQNDLHPWGTHPDLDHHWSGSRLRMEHDAVDVTRPEKVRALADHQVALDHLRVCFKNPDGAYNCGRCEKCLRTMVNLSAVGALARCRTLPGTLDLRDVRRMRVSSQAAHFFVSENIAMLQSQPEGERDADLLKALKVARALGYVRRPVRAAGRPAMRRVVRPVRRRLRARRRSAAQR